ncbi:MAG TPA: YggT family protein [Syntrophorhabdaceae bacterium]|nr:YggT family protein [Syntrophorhabdaceae bacterium]
MFIVGNLFSAIASILDTLLDIYLLVIVVRVLLSWVRPDPYNPIVRTLNRLVDPVTYRISRIIPTRVGMVDIAPFILMLCIIFFQRFLVKSLADMAIRMH